MSKTVVEVQIRAVAATSGGFAVFLGNQDKAFVIFVDQSVGAAIAMFMQGTKKQRPLTQNLLANILRALRSKDRNRRLPSQPGTRQEVAHVSPERIVDAHEGRLLPRMGVSRHWLMW
jgi:hypothetical protein